MGDRNRLESAAQGSQSVRSGRAGSRPHLVQIPAALRSVCWRRLRSRSYSRAFSASRRGLPSGPEPGGAGAVGCAALVQARFAERALRRGPGLAALDAQPGRAAFLGALVEAFEIAPPLPGDVAASHDGPLPADPKMDGKDVPLAPGRQDRPGREPSTLLEERGRVGSERLGWLHGAVSFVPVRESGGWMPSPGHPPAAPLTASLFLSAANPHGRGLHSGPGECHGDGGGRGDGT